MKLQDRIIQLEMQVRCARVLPAGQDELLAQLSPKQVVALRFASDAELGDLLARAVREQMTPRRHQEGRQAVAAGLPAHLIAAGAPRAHDARLHVSSRSMR